MPIEILDGFALIYTKVAIYATRDQNKINGLVGLMNVTTQITELPQENHLILESTKPIYQYIIFRLSSSTTVCC